MLLHTQMYVQILLPAVCFCISLLYIYFSIRVCPHVHALSSYDLHIYKKKKYALDHVTLILLKYYNVKAKTISISQTYTIKYLDDGSFKRLEWLYSLLTVGV